MLGRLLLDVFKHGPTGALAAKGSAGLLQTDGAALALPDVLPLDDINCLVKARHGWFLANRYDHYLGSALIRYGECCEVEHEFLASLLRPGDGVVEVGANIGVHTVGLARTVGAAGRVVAVEAQPAIFRVLCANLALNALFNVTPHACGCSDRRDTLIAPAVDYGSAAPHNSGGVSLAADGAGIPVPVSPLDELVDELPGFRLLKIDVEGMEREVLQGARRLIGEYRPLLYVENDRVEKSKALIEWIMAAGYRLWWHTPPLFNPANLFGVAQNDYPRILSFNMICQPAQAGLPPPAGLTEITDPGHHPLAR